MCVLGATSRIAPTTGDQEPVPAMAGSLLHAVGDDLDQGHYFRIGAAAAAAPRYARRRAESRPGGSPNWRRYSRLNCDALS